MFQTRGSMIFNEIMEQPQAWEKTIKKFEEQITELSGWFAQENFKQLLFVGCGSSYNIGMYSSRAMNYFGFQASQAFPASELFFYPQVPLVVRENTLAVLISRSGETDEMIKAAGMLRQHQVKILLLCCQNDSTLGRMADKVIVLEEAMDEGIAAIKSFSGLLLLSLLICGLILNKPEFVAELKTLPGLFNLKDFQKEIQNMGMQKYNRVVCLGNGFNEGMAREAALKIIEISSCAADAHQAMEYRHGTIGSIYTQTLVVIFQSDTFKDYERHLSREIAAYKGARALICEEADQQTKMATEYIVELKSGLSEISRGILMLPPLQLFAFHLAMAKGINPDKLRRVAQVVRLKEPGWREENKTDAAEETESVPPEKSGEMSSVVENPEARASASPQIEN